MIEANGILVYGVTKIDVRTEEFLFYSLSGVMVNRSYYVIVYDDDNIKVIKNRFCDSIALIPQEHWVKIHRLIALDKSISTSIIKKD